jgi:hypothetical protein
VPWIVAAEGTESAMGASPACAVPDGTTHAFDTATSRTACGRRADELIPFPELAWPPVGVAAVDTCPACDRAT